MSDPDEREMRFHQSKEQYECECGYELSRDNPPRHCDRCDSDCCSECSHLCEYCGRYGCETCMTHTVDGWCHAEECAAANKAVEDRRDREANEMLERIRKAG